MSDYSDAVLADGPLGYWRFEEAPACGNFADGGTFADSSGNGHTAYHYGEGGNCLDTQHPEILCTPQGGFSMFNGSLVHAVARVHRTAGLEPASDVSVEQWMLGANIGSIGGSDNIILEYGSYGYGYRTDNVADSRNVGFYVTLGGVEHILWAGAGTLASDTLVHLVSTYDGSTIRFFVNGVEVDSASFSGSITYNGTTGLGILNDYQPAGNGYPNTPIDELAIYDYALTDLQIATHYALGTCGALPTPATCSLLETDDVLLVDATYQDVTVTLMDPAPLIGHVYRIRRIDNSTNIVTLDPGTLLIDGLPSVTLYPGDGVALVTNGYDWNLV